MEEEGRTTNKQSSKRELEIESAEQKKKNRNQTGCQRSDVEGNAFEQFYITVKSD